MRRILVSVILSLSHSLSLAQKKPNSEISVIDEAKKIDVNNLEMFVNNKALLCKKPDSYNGGLYIKGEENETGLITQLGILFGAKDGTNNLLLSGSFFKSAFLPGEINKNGEAANYNDEKYRVFKIQKNDGVENPDYAEFPCKLGAPCNSDGTPKMIGDQILWCVYNDIHPDVETEETATEDRIGIEIRQTIFAFESESLIGNTIFLKYQIFNKGNKHLKDAYFSLFPEAYDVSTYRGCSPELDLAYFYNSDSYDNTFTEIPAIGFKLLQGPMVPLLSSQAKAFGKEFNGFKNLGMTAFSAMPSGGIDPPVFYKYMQGKRRDGRDYINPITGDTTTFWHSGNPITLQGDLQKNWNRTWFISSSGGFEMAPGDSQEVIFALVVGQCESNLLSLSEVFSTSKEVQRFFDNNYSFPEPPKQPEVSYEIGNEKIFLDWAQSKDLIENSFNTEKYSFEGYSIYQGETENGPWKLVKRFDIANQISNIKNSTFNKEICFEETRAWISPDLGLEYSFEITQDYLRNEPLENWKEYYFAVSSYAARTDEYSSVLESPKTILEIAPQPQEITSEELVKITPVPNPYYGRSEYENGDEVVIRFVNLPDTKKTTIRIFNLSGDLVTTLEKEANTGSRFLDWNGTNKNGRKCASGVYIYHIQIEGLGEKTGKMICAFRR